uniref:Uncharacterized protein n=1 Tax=Anguilla anguilla TaxID=7936 RepID=A0A0E9UQB6_ANGAN
MQSSWARITAQPFPIIFHRVVDNIWNDLELFLHAVLFEILDILRFAF